MTSSSRPTDPFEEYRLSRTPPTRRTGILEWILILLLGLANAGVWIVAGPRLAAREGSVSGVKARGVMPDGVLTVVQLDVGQGDGTFIHTPGGKNILIDAGEGEHPENQYSRQYPATKEVVIPFLALHGIVDLDLVILTHPDSDHGGGMPDLFEWVLSNGGHVRRFVDPGITKAARFYQDILEAIEKLDIPYYAVLDPSTEKPVEYPKGVFEGFPGGTLIGNEIVHDPTIAFQILGPLGLINEGDAANDHSIVTRIQCGDISFLSAGDAEAAEEEMLVRFWGKRLHSTVHFPPHHGSKTSHHPFWIRMVNPEIISTSSHPPVFGHPAPETLAAYKKFCKPPPRLYLRTDLNGDIWYRTDGKKLAIRTQFKYQGEEKQWEPGKRGEWKLYRRFEANAPTIWEDCHPVPGTDEL
ncbi:MAG: MBL fold metallo-hydrolase [Candidatus Hydrogenedentota bacterium]|nr:MAG: MBL fold metallo-hydrolase [Candidatus Hydrogenedentota bacterium]